MGAEDHVHDVAHQQRQRTRAREGLRPSKRAEQHARVKFAAGPGPHDGRVSTAHCPGSPDRFDPRRKADLGRAKSQEKPFDRSDTLAKPAEGQKVAAPPGARYDALCEGLKLKATARACCAVLAFRFAPTPRAEVLHVADKD